VNLDLEGIKLANGLKRECSFGIVRGPESIFVAAETPHDQQRWFKEVGRARSNLSLPDTPRPTLCLSCMGTVLITVLSAANLRSAEIPYCLLELNNQRVELKLSVGPNPIWNQSVVLSMSSYDDILVLSVFNYRKYAPDQLLGTTDLSLDFLEYYDQRSTDKMDLKLGSTGKIAITLQYHALL